MFYFPIFFLDKIVTTQLCNKNSNNMVIVRRIGPMICRPWPHWQPLLAALTRVCQWGLGLQIIVPWADNKPLRPPKPCYCYTGRNFWNNTRRISKQQMKSGSHYKIGTSLVWNTINWSSLTMWHNVTLLLLIAIVICWGYNRASFKEGLNIPLTKGSWK